MQNASAGSFYPALTTSIVGLERIGRQNDYFGVAAAATPFSAMMLHSSNPYFNAASALMPQFHDQLTQWNNSVAMMNANTNTTTTTTQINNSAEYHKAFAQQQQGLQTAKFRDFSKMARQQQQQQQQQHQHHHQYQMPIMSKMTRSDNSEATSHKESTLSDDEVDHIPSPPMIIDASLNEESTIIDDASTSAEQQEQEQEQQKHSLQLAKPIIDDSLPKPCASKTCAFCRTQKTPLWRNGPFGAKTLCNACGVRFKLGKLAGDEDGHVVSVIVPRQKRRKNGSAGTASYALANANANAHFVNNNVSAAMPMFTNPAVERIKNQTGFVANAPLKVRHTVHTKNNNIEPKARGIVGGWRPEMGGPMRVSSPFVVTDYDGAVLLMVLAGENDANNNNNNYYYNNLSAEEQ
jgi:hypothetical protein